MRANASIITPPHELLEQPRHVLEHHEPDDTTTAQKDADTSARQIAGTPPLPATIPEPTSPLEALQLMQRQGHFQAGALLSIARYFIRKDQNPLSRDYMLEASNNWEILDRMAGRPAKSITVYAPGQTAVSNGALLCVGIGGRAPVVAAGAYVLGDNFLTLPLQADDIRIGFDTTTQTPTGPTPLFVIRWPTIQPFAVL